MMQIQKSSLTLLYKGGDKKINQLTVDKLMKTTKIPEAVLIVMEKLKKAGFESYLVGGCVRDLLMDIEPKDWDVTTNAKPEELLKIIPDGKYENQFGTVMVPLKYANNLNLLSEGFEISEEKKEKAIEIAKEYLAKVKCKAHDISHTERVVENALKIAGEYKKISKDFLEIAAWFHDIGRAYFDDKRHVEKSVEIAREELDKFLSKEDLDKLILLIDHKHILPKDIQFIEKAIMIEADYVDGINRERFEIVKRVELKEHFDWIKNSFNKENIYKSFTTQKGKELFNEQVDLFNKEDFDLKLEKIEIGNENNIEITTYRIESTYSDKRHPDEVQFAETLEEDLSRRDFTVNAMAIELDEKGEQKQIVDLFGGQKDLKGKIIRAVGKPDERFDEDALRMMRAIRFAVKLGFEIDNKTLESIEKNSKNLRHISQERIRDEFDKIILSENPSKGVELLIETKLLDQFIPEIIETIGVKQNRHHYYGPYNTVFAHMLASLEKCPSEKLEVRLASFFHDIGKPKSKRGKGETATFHGHEYGGARMVEKIMKRMKYPRKIIEKTVMLVKNHMFYYNVDEVGEAGVRKVIRKVGLENISDLIDVRIADRLGSGVPKAVPYRLRHFKYMVEKVSKDPISVKQLKLNGDIMIAEMDFKPGPEIGAILDVLLAEVIENPELNDLENLKNRAEELRKEDLQSLRFLAKKKIKEEQEKDDEETKGKYWVK